MISVYVVNLNIRDRHKDIAMSFATIMMFHFLSQDTLSKGNMQNYRVNAGQARNVYTAFDIRGW